MKQSTEKKDDKQWEGNIVFQYFDANLRLSQKIKTVANCFIYGQVIRGHVLLNYEGHQVTVKEGGLICFPPLIPPKVISTSNDYICTCLIVNTDFAYANPSSRYLFHNAMFVKMHPEDPVIDLDRQEMQQTLDTLHAINYHIQHPHPYNYDALQSLLSLYLIDMMGILNKRMDHDLFNHKQYKIYLGFSDLMSRHFQEQHEINFYADALKISPRYLSMIVKQITHETVTSLINRKLMYRACWLLRSTDHSISEISNQLHFSDQASFSKFFKRMNGKSPLQYKRKI